jgi:PAS domain S-box-containing protein
MRAAGPVSDPTPRPRHTVHLRPHQLVLAVGAGAILTHQLLPQRLQEFSYDGIEILVLLAMLWGIRRHRPQPSRPWWLLATGVGLLVVGDVIYNALTRINGEEVFPSVADALYIASYLTLSWGVMEVLRSRRRRRDGTALVDAVLVTVASAGITWVYLIAPSDYVGVPVLTALVSAAYPVGDLVLLALLARLLFAPGTRSPAERILAVGISMLLVADVAYARLALIGAYGVGSWLDAVFHASYLCFAVAACHPTMRSLAASEPEYALKTRSRLWLLTGISLVLPTLAGLQHAGGNERNAVILGAASAISFFLLTLRTGVLNASLAAALNREADAVRRERILRHLGTVLVTTHDRGEIFEAAVDHARQVAGEGADALLLFRDDGSALVATCGCDECTPGSHLMLDQDLPQNLDERLLEGGAVTIGPADEPDLRSLLPAAFRARQLFAAPILSGDRRRGVLLVAPAGAGEQRDRLAAACEAVASAVSLALESADLAERLVDERSEQRFAAMIRNSSDIVLVLRADGTVRFLSPSVTRVLGWDVEDLLGQHLTALVHPDDASIVTSALTAALTTAGTHGPFQCRYQHKDTTWRYLEAIGMSLVDDPAVGGVIVNVRDVTDRVRLEESLRASEERLESQVAELQELHRAKNDFVATVSHELRTPLTTILGQLELLSGGDYGALLSAQYKAIDAIDRNSQRLLALIEDLLTVARIDSARLQLDRVATEVRPFVERVHGSMAVVAATRPVTLALHADPCLGTASVDPLQMERALGNLISNAIKFTAPGGLVELRSRRSGNDLAFTVADNGIGIPVAEQEKLFTRFFRSSIANRMAVQGSGLGLVIAKAIVEEHGGTIALTSAQGEGTTVTVVIPAGPAPASGQDVAEGIAVLGPEVGDGPGTAEAVALGCGDAQRPEGA